MLGPKFVQFVSLKKREGTFWNQGRYISKTPYGFFHFVQNTFGIHFGKGKRSYPFSMIQGIYIHWIDSTEKPKTQLMKQLTKALSTAIFMTSSVGSGGFSQCTSYPRVHIDEEAFILVVWNKMKVKRKLQKERKQFRKKLRLEITLYGCSHYI